MINSLAHWPLAALRGVRSFWSKLSRPQKIFWAFAVIWIVLHVVGYAVAIPSDDPSANGNFGIDLKTYLTAGQQEALHQPIYELTKWANGVNYRYHPLFAMLFSGSSPDNQVAIQENWLLLMALAYIASLFVWYYVLKTLDPTLEGRLNTVFPFALIASDWIATLAYGNVTLWLVLLSGLLALALIKRQWVFSGILVALIVLLKPQWAFPLILPIVFKEWKFLFRVLVVAVGAYVVATFGYILLTGSYGIQTLQNYVTFLMHASANYPWQGQEAAFWTLQDSIYQTWLRYFGFQPWVGFVTLLCQAGLVAVFFLYLNRVWTQKAENQADLSRIGLALMFATYALGMLMLSEIIDCTLSGIIFVYLMASADKRTRQIALPMIVFILFEIPSFIYLGTGLRVFDWNSVIPLRLLTFLLTFGGSLYVVKTILQPRQEAVAPAPTNTGWAKLTRFWASSGKVFKVVTIVTFIWVAIHAIGYMYASVYPEQMTQDMGINADYDFYAKTGTILDQRGPIYDIQSNPLPAFTFKYHPAFALVMSWINRGPSDIAVSLWYLFLVVGYVAGVGVWFVLFSRLNNFKWAAVGFAALVPLLAYDWLGTLGFGNISPALFLLSGLLMMCVLDRRPVWAGLLTAVLALVKFYWCFPLVVLVVFKEWRMLARVLITAALFYLGITAAYLVAVGNFSYGLSTLHDYFVYLMVAGSRQPWHGMEAMFNTGNNAIYETIVRYFGFTSWAAPLTTLVQAALVGFFVWQLWQTWRAGISRTNRPENAYLVAFMLYIVLMCLLAEVNDGLFSGIICVLLISMVNSRRWAMFYVPIALCEFAALVGMFTGVNWLVLPTTFPLILVGFGVLMIGATRAMVPVKSGETFIRRTQTIPAFSPSGK